MSHAHLLVPMDAQDEEALHALMEPFSMDFDLDDFDQGKYDYYLLVEWTSKALWQQSCPENSPYSYAFLADGRWREAWDDPEFDKTDDGTDAALEAWWRREPVNRAAYEAAFDEWWTDLPDGQIIALIDFHS